MESLVALDRRTPAMRWKEEVVTSTSRKVTLPSSSLSTV
jgi:hypothetical protein